MNPIEQQPQPSGCVALVGAGPGDPELLTLKALKRLQAADIVVYDNLVSPAIMALVPAGIERRYVGKKAGNHCLPQEDINGLLVSLAQSGKQVVRLKGGDPFIFGRGGEEAERLAAAGVRFEIVPGITSASGISACAGIPLTHRDHAQSCVFVTGHQQPGGGELDWAALAKPRQTLVIYMGISHIETICASLIAHGLPADTPAAVVRHGTQPDQLVLTAPLAQLAQATRARNITPPALIIIGQVVQLQQKLNWFPGSTS
jgi:uroporphyrin-III C-methyltransferase